MKRFRPLCIKYSPATGARVVFKDDLTEYDGPDVNRILELEADVIRDMVARFDELTGAGQRHATPLVDLSSRDWSWQVERDWDV